MKSLIQAVVVAAALVAPVVSLAQSNERVTRAQVRAELVQLEKAGYNPVLGENPYYPADIQAAEAKVATQSGVAAGYSDDVNVSSEAGRPAVSKMGRNAIYSHP